MRGVSRHMKESKLRSAPLDLEERARAMFAEGLTPDEYAARYAHTIACFSLDEYRYRDPTLHAWIQSLGAIFFGRPGAPTIEEVRQRHLTAEQRAEVKRLENEDF
jgi:hypothetical protein